MKMDMSDLRPKTLETDTVLLVSVSCKR